MRSAKIDNGAQPLTIFAKHLILDGSEYASVYGIIFSTRARLGFNQLFSHLFR